MEDIEIKTFIKDTRLVNPQLITLVTYTGAKLREQDLSDSKRLDLVVETLKITSQFCHNLASKTKTSFKEQDKEFFYQNLMILTLILRTAFPLEWFKKRSVIDWSNEFTHNQHIWNNLLYKAIRVLTLDLGLELLELYKQLDFILVKEPSDWIFFIRMVSQVYKYFPFQISQIEKIVFTGLEKPIEEHEAYKEYNSFKYTEKVLRINQLRRDSMVSFYNKTCEACFEDQFFLVTGELVDTEKIEFIRNLADLTPLAYKSELNSNLL